MATHCSQDGTKIEKKVIEVKYSHHLETVLTNEKGDTFTFNPNKHEGLADFFSR